MTPIIFILGYCSGLVLTFVRHPIYGVYTYLFTFYMAPGYSWWRNDIPEFRYLLIAAAAAVVASFRLPLDTERAKWYQTGGGRLFLLFVLYIWVQTIWAIDRGVHLDGAILYSKHLISFYLIYRFSYSLENLKNIAFAHVLGCAWFGYVAFGAGGGRLENIGGAVAGSNELGVHISTGLLFGGLLLLGLRGARRAVVFGSLPLILNTLVLTISRGAFLGFFAGGIAGYFGVPKYLKRRYVLCGALGVVLLGMLAHDSLIERFTQTYLALTTDYVELDSSAAGRTDIALAGLRMGMDYPLGAGYKATAILSPLYMDESLLSRWGQRSAHNTSAAVVAEHGFPGLLIYYLMILWVLWTLYRMRRARGSVEQEQLGVLATAAAASLVAVYVACNFSNNIDLETQYWCLALLASAYELSRAKVREKATSAEPSPPGGRSLLRHRPGY